MSRTIIAKYVTPWKYRRAQNAQRLAALRQRDGEDCRRCRRPLRFDLPNGHDQGPRIEHMTAGQSGGETAELDELCLTHVRCNPANDHTSEVLERIRRKNEAVLFTKSRKRRKA
jgi:hypothetical protein